MRVEEAYKQFSDFKTSHKNCFEGVDIGIYNLSDPARSAIQSQLWLMEDNLLPEFHAVMDSVPQLETMESQDNECSSGAWSVIHAIQSSIKRNKDRVPLFMVLDFMAAWDSLENSQRGVKACVINSWITKYQETIQVAFLGKVRSSVKRMGRSSRRNELELATVALLETEANLDLLPCAFTGNQLVSLISKLGGCKGELNSFSRGAHADAEEGIRTLREGLRNLNPEVWSAADLNKVIAYRQLSERNLLNVEIVEEYSRLHSVSEILREMHDPGKDGTWFLVADELFNLFLSEKALDKNVKMQQRIDIASPTIIFHDSVEPLLQYGGQICVAVKDLINSRCNNSIYIGNSFHVKTLLCMFFGYLITGTQREKIVSAMELFQRRVIELDEVLGYYQRFTPDALKSMWKDLAAAMVEVKPLRFGHGYHLFSILDRTTAEGGGNQSAILNLIGANMQDIIINQAPVLSPLCRFFADITIELERVIQGSFAREYFADLGLIIEPEFRLLDKRHRSHAADFEKPEYLLLKEFKWSNKPFEKAHNSLPTLDVITLQLIDGDANAIIDLIKTKDKLKKTLYDEVKGFTVVKVVQAMIARRVIYWVATRDRDKRVVEVVLGYPKRRPHKKSTKLSGSKSSKPKKKRPNIFANVNKNLNQWGLSIDFLSNPENFDVWTEDEKKFDGSSMST